MRSLPGCVLLLALAACDVSDEAEQRSAGPTIDQTLIECALDGASEFANSCSVEKAAVDGGRVLIVRHPDGSFRRFDVLTDGRGLAVADGADEGRMTVEDEILAVAVANDRYRFPVTLKSDDPAK